MRTSDTHPESPPSDDLGVVSKPPWREVAEQHGEPLNINGGFLLLAGGGDVLEGNTSSPETGLTMSLLRGIRY